MIEKIKRKIAFHGPLLLGVLILLVILASIFFLMSAVIRDCGFANWLLYGNKMVLYWLINGCTT